MKYTLEVKEKDNGELYVEFPDELLKTLDWKENDELTWKDLGDGSFSLTKVCNNTETKGAISSITKDIAIDNEIINKGIAEMKSYFGCGEPVYSKIKIVESICLFISKWKYKLTGGLYFKTKYFIQRLTRGYDDLDKWNAAWFIARKTIPVLTDMRNSFHGTSIKWHREDRFGNIVELTHDEVYNSDEVPESFTEDEWRSILDEIIYGFRFVLDLDKDIEFNESEYNKNLNKHKRGLKLFSIYFMNLWD